MHTPPEVPIEEPGRAAGGGAGPAGALWRAIVRWSIVAAFVLRAAVSLADAHTVATGGIVSVPFSSVEVGGDSALWPATWGVLALVVAAALALRVGIGWLLGAVVTVAYIVTGISDASTISNTFSIDFGRAVVSVAVGLVLPLAVLAGLFSIRETYLSAAHPESHRRAMKADPAHQTLDHWRRRR